VLLFSVAYRLTRGRPGRAMLAVREHPIAAVAMGVDTAMVKSAAFGVSAAITGPAGALSALSIQYVAPDSFSGLLSLSLLTGAVIGGLGSLAGPFLGALFVQFVPNLAEDLSKSAPWLVYGLLLLACMYAMPSGAAGFVTALRRKLSPSR
jgi:branched-chain amino acid transport system permease protein